MADQLYLSYWLRGFSAHNMLRYFEKLLARFPFSTQSPRGSVLRVYAIEPVEPALFEHSYDWNAGVEMVIENAREFQNADCGYFLDAYWDLWQFQESWKLAPSSVSLACFGPLFQNDVGDQLRIECGLDADFLPQPDVPGSAAMVQSNIKGLLRLAHELDNSFPVDKRQLWSESGENFAERLQAAWMP